MNFMNKLFAIYTIILTVLFFSIPVAITIFYIMDFVSLTAFIIGLIIFIMYFGIFILELIESRKNKDEK